MPLSRKGGKVVARTGAKSVNAVTGDTKSQVTVLAYCCANGGVVPPFVIFDRKVLNPELTTGKVKAGLTRSYSCIGSTSIFFHQSPQYAINGWAFEPLQS